MPGIFKYFFYNNKRGIQNANNTKQHSVCRSLSLFSPILLCFIKPEFAWKWDETDKERIARFFLHWIQIQKIVTKLEVVKALQMKIFYSSPNGIQIAQKSKPILQANRFHFYFQCQCTGSLFDSLSTRPDGWTPFLLQMKKSGA